MESLLEPLFSSGRIIELILLLVLVEAALLAWASHRAGRNDLFAGVAPTLISGALLLLTIRAALLGAWWGWIATTLILALLSHIVDLALRWRSGGH
jgi:hypothetical protein